jgi:hypothetical protein
MGIALASKNSKVIAPYIKLFELINCPKIPIVSRLNIFPSTQSVLLITGFDTFNSDVTQLDLEFHLDYYS